MPERAVTAALLAWWLRVAGSGPVDVVATMRQGDERRFVPVKVPATCGTGAVTRR